MRVHGWPQILSAKIEEWRGRAFAWGTADCCQFVGDVAAALTGTDKRGLFPTYTDEASAQAVIAEYGGLDAILTEAFGASKHPSKAMRGDVVMVKGILGWQPAICLGLHSVAPGANGLASVRTSSATLAWSV